MHLTYWVVTPVQPKAVTSLQLSIRFQLPHPIPTTLHLHQPPHLTHPGQPSLPTPPSHRLIPHHRGAPERKLFRPLEHRREIPTPAHVPPAIDAQVPLHHGGGLERGIRRAPDGLPEVVEAVGHVAHADGLAVDGGVDALAEHVLAGSAGEKETGKGMGEMGEMGGSYEAVQLVEDGDAEGAGGVDVEGRDGVWEGVCGAEFGEGDEAFAFCGVGSICIRVGGGGVWGKVLGVMACQSASERGEEGPVYSGWREKRVGMSPTGVVVNGCSVILGRGGTNVGRWQDRVGQILQTCGAWGSR